MISSKIQFQCKHELWSSIYKHSHPNKTLSEHIEETLKYYIFLKKYFGLDRIDEYIDRIIHFIIKYHDMGKLYYKWGLGANIGHSEKSLLWLLCNESKLNEKDREVFIKYKPLLLYLIAKHHSILTKDLSIYIRDINLRNLLKTDTLFSRVVRKTLKTYFTENVSKINLMDLYGLFKIADILSADNRNPAELLQNLTITENDIRNLIGRVDEERLKKQLSISNLSGLVLLRAPTGWGKTNTSLAYSIGKYPSKIFILLPTTTAINKFYKKLEKVFNKNIGRYFYMYDAYLVSDDNADDEEYERLNRLFYVRNFIDKYINITTIDQFLFPFIQLRRYFLKRFVFRNSLIVLDEVHLLTPPILKILMWVFEKYIPIYNLDILLMSATFPNNLRQYINDKLGDITRVTVLDYAGDYKDLRRVRYILCDTDILTAIQSMVKDVNQGLKVLVIVNTVDKAVSIANILTNELGKDKVILLHARMMYKHRVEKEEYIDRLTKEPHVLVATQVAEVSLDISYDKLYTELAPLSSIMQRFGRINRYGNDASEINAYLFDVKLQRENYPYPIDELKISWDVLSQFQEDRLRSEYQLIKAYDEIENYDDFLSRLDRETSHISPTLVSELHDFIFSIDLSEEAVKKLLNYRDKFTILFIPHQDMIPDEYENLKNKIEMLIKTDYKSLSEKDRIRYESEVKSHLINCPYYIISRSKPIDMVGFPIYLLEDYIYNPYYGLIKEEEEAMII